MRRFLPIYFFIFFLSDDVIGQDTWTRSFGIEFMPHSYVPQNDPDKENKFRVGYAVGPCVRFHKKNVAIVMGLRYSRVNKHTIYTQEGVSPVFGYYIISTDNKRSLNHIELPFSPGIGFGNENDKIIISPGIVASYLFGGSYSGTNSFNYQTEEFSGYYHNEDWIWLGSFTVSYFHEINSKFGFEIGEQTQYSFDYHYFLFGVDLKFYFSPAQKKSDEKG